MENQITVIRTSDNKIILTFDGHDYEIKEAGYTCCYSPKFVELNLSADASSAANEALITKVFDEGDFIYAAGFDFVYEVDVEVIEAIQDVIDEATVDLHGACNDFNAELILTSEFFKEIADYEHGEPIVEAGNEYNKRWVRRCDVEGCFS